MLWPCLWCYLWQADFFSVPKLVEPGSRTKYMHTPRATMLCPPTLNSLETVACAQHQWLGHIFLGEHLLEPLLRQEGYPNNIDWGCGFLVFLRWLYKHNEWQPVEIIVSLKWFAIKTLLEVKLSGETFSPPIAALKVCQWHPTKLQHLE